MTAIRALQLDGRIKTALAFDPWLFVHIDSVNNGMLKIERPFFTIMTEQFPKRCEGFDVWSGIKNLHKFSNSGKNENVILKTAYHTD